GAGVQCRRTVPTLNIPFAGNRWQHLAAFFARVGVEVDAVSAGQTGLSPRPYALLALPGALAPGCRFARRSIPRTSGKLALVSSPDAVNDAGGSDACPVSVPPPRPRPSPPPSRLAP